MRPVGHIQPRRPALDAAQHEMPDGIEADRAQAQGIFDGMSYFFQSEGLQQPQHLDVLAGSVLVEPRFEQTAQMSKALW